jgi:cystathionine beta-lyase
MAYFKDKIPAIKVIKPQGTYLLWLDCRGLKLDDKGLSDFMKSDCKVGLDDGSMFGAGGSGFERMNIACPRPLLKEALERIEKAVKKL